VPAFRLTAKARAALIDIGCYTQRPWGRDQRNRYLSRLDAAFHLLAQEPDRGRPCDESRRGYRKHHVGRHMIFYRQAGPDIEILHI
jgi:toxin ParE1/3/4